MLPLTVCFQTPLGWMEGGAAEGLREFLGRGEEKDGDGDGGGKARRHRGLQAWRRDGEYFK